jgi:DNA-binding CsgD family transcriptional regulator
MTRDGLSVPDFELEHEVVEYHDHIQAEGLMERITPHERRIFRLLGLGMSRSEIGRAVKRSPQTISNSLTVAKEKIGARSIVHAAVLLARPTGRTVRHTRVLTIQ